MAQRDESRKHDRSGVELSSVSNDNKLDADYYSWLLRLYQMKYEKQTCRCGDLLPHPLLKVKYESLILDCAGTKTSQFLNSPISTDMQES